MARPITILAVDDDPFYTSMLEHVLKLEGSYHVLTAANVADAMVVAERHLPALVITDRYMPGRDGFDFCLWLKAHPALSDSMVMLLTASAGTENIVRGLDLGADDYLVKPFEPEELLSRVRALLRIKKLGDQLREDNARLEAMNCALSENLAGVMHLLTHIIELRVPESSNRAEQAGGMVLWIGERLGLPKEALDELLMAARVREIGKIVMPDEVLTTAHPLSGEQQETLSQYPLFGQMLVGRIPQLRACAAIIRSQCENFDGSGFPDQLTGAQIPLPARILRAVCVLESLPAPSGPAGCPPVALAEALGRASGTLLDPAVAKYAVEYLTSVNDPSWMVGKRLVAVPNIEEGMTIAADVCTAKGVKLLPKDTCLTGSHIARIQSHNRKDPILSGIYIYH